VSAALSFEDILTGFLQHALRPVVEREEVVASDDPRRNPNYCWTHNMIWPACADRH
jgi:hypothetical protein